MKKYPENKGFIALITALMVSTGLILMALSASQSISIIFDEASRKQYRISATEAALACMNQVSIELEHDYFYAVGPAVLPYPDLHCSVVSVTSTGLANINNPTPIRKIEVAGYSSASSTASGSITADITAQVLINSQNISLMSETTTFH